MQAVATLIGHKDRALTEGDVSAAMALAAEADIFIEKKEWLAPQEACDLFAIGEVDALRAALLPHTHKQALDVIVQGPENRRKKALFADMESTLIKEEMLEELADFVGVRTQVEIITRRAMNGELDFKAALQERLSLLKNIPAKVLDTLAAKMTLMDGAAELVTAMRNHGAYCVLVSGGFKIFTNIIAKQLGFDEDYGNTLDVHNDVITGAMLDPVLDKNSKLEILNRVSAAHGLTAADCVAVGDGANDIPMLKAAGLGVGFHAKPAVTQQIPHTIRFAGLRALLWAQGYHTSDLHAYSKK